jgi:hypothetical protein
MKQLQLFGSLILGVIFTLSSCQKCQECRTDMKIFYTSGYETDYTNTKEYCGRDYQYAPESGLYYENIVGGYQTTEITCVDTK